MRWRLMQSGVQSGSLNMALDEALLHFVASGRSLPVLRFYRWAVPTLTLGYGQRGGDSVNLQACRTLGVEVVRRPTGGRAVLHQREVTYALISPESNGVFQGGIIENYRVIAEVLQDALHSLGIDSSLSTARTQGQGGGAAERNACFTAPAVTELVYRGCKLTGGAQKRQGGVFLQHGSIPVDMDLELLFKTLDTDGLRAAETGARALQAKVGWINRWMSAPLAMDEVEAAILEAFVRRFGGDYVAGGPTEEEMELCRVLMSEKYGSLL